MNVLIVDQDNVGLSLALRANAAGHTVRWFVKNREDNNPSTGQGFRGITKVDNWVTNASWAELICAPSGGAYVEKLDFFSKKGYSVFSSSAESAKLERFSTGMAAMSKAGIDVAPHKSFPTMSAAEKHVFKTRGRFAFKTEDGSKTYAARSPADMVAYLRRTAPPNGDVVLQDFVSGTSIGASRFMGKSGWVGQWNESLDACPQGSVGYFVKESKIGEILGKLEDTLKSLKHIGNVRVQFIVDDAGKAWATAITCGMMWPAASMTLGATKGDPVTWMKSALDGKDKTTFSEDIGCCINVRCHEGTNGVPVYGVTRGNLAHIHPLSIQMMKLPAMEKEAIAEKTIWATAGKNTAIVTGFGSSVSQATKRAYKTIDQLHVADSTVRDNVGRRLKDQLPILHALGYATGCEF